MVASTDELAGRALAETEAEAPARRRPTAPARRTAFALLCRMLSHSDTPPAGFDRDAAEIDWVTLIEIANRHRVVANLAAAAAARPWPADPAPGRIFHVLELAVHAAEDQAVDGAAQADGRSARRRLGGGDHLVRRQEIAAQQMLHVAQIAQTKAPAGQDGGSRRDTPGARGRGRGRQWPASRDDRPCAASRDGGAARW